jgi:DNA-directed RNA polymerase specialized sigma24 family protein
MSNHIDTTTFEQRLDDALHAPEVARLLSTHLRPRPGAPTPAEARTLTGATVVRRAAELSTPDDLAVAVHDAMMEVLLPHTAAYHDAMNALMAPAMRRFVARNVPAGEIDDVLADARARVWTALRHTLPKRGGAFATRIAGNAAAEWGRRNGRRLQTVLLTAPGGTTTDVVDPAGERALDGLTEAEALHDLLKVLTDHGATRLELQRLMAFVLADGDAAAAVELLPTPCRPATLNQSITSLRNRL